MVADSEGSISYGLVLTAILVVFITIFTFTLLEYNTDLLIGEPNNVDDNSEDRNDSVNSITDNKTANIELISDGSVVDTVTAEKSTTRTERYVGLSNRETLQDGEGMIFIYNDSSNRTFAMRDMNFGLDIVFVSSNCSVNSIEHAEKPSLDETGEEKFNRYNGTGKYVIELPYNYTENRISEGDSISFTDC